MPRTAMLVTPTTQEQARRWPALLASALWVLTLLALPMVNWLDQLLRQAGLPELAILEPAAFPLVAAALTAATVGAVLASRRPRHPVGWLLLAIGLSQQFSNLATDYVHYGAMVRPDGLPAATYLTGFYNSGTIVMVACVGFVMLLTPTGSLPSPRWRWWARVVVAATVVLVMDNLNTHKPASLYEAFAPAEARRLMARLEIHYTPKHGCWLNMAETDLSVLTTQCLDRRIPDATTLTQEIAAWERHRNEAKCRVEWRFTTHEARIKLKRLYPSSQLG